MANIVCTVKLVCANTGGRHMHLSMQLSVVGAVPAILLLLLLCRFSFIFYCETMARGSAATLWNN